MSIYNGFDSKEELAGSFSVSLASLKNANIIYASYETMDYEGYAFILYEEAGRFYEVNGSHCSCYGLEGQWEPEETNLEVLQHRIEKGNLRKSLNGYDKEILEVLKSYNKPVQVVSNSRFKLD